MKEINLLWENFVSKGSNAETETHVRKDILESWKRCQTNGVSPLIKHANEAITRWELKELLTESELYHVARPIIDSIFNKLIGTGYMITLNNEEGKIIYLNGEKSVINQTKDTNFAVGMDWSENATGTNAIGTCLTTKKPIQVFAGEHFCTGFHSMTCSSAPIFQPHTNKVIGVIDLTGFWENGQPHTLAFAVSIAQLVEQELLNLHLERHNYLAQYYYQNKYKRTNDLFLVLNMDLVVINGNKRLMHLLNVSVMEDISEHSLFRISFEDQIDPQKQNSLNPTFSFTDVERNILKVNEIEAVYLKDKRVGYMITFSENKHSGTNTPALIPLPPSHRVLGQSNAFIDVLQKCRKGAEVNVPMLLLGETGTGKEVLAKYIHLESTRKDKPFIAINCGTVQKELIASELFGYESGTFTGGIKEGKKGKFEEAQGGTLFLDEIGEMPLELQVHLLRVLQEKEFEKLGSSKTINVDVRIIAATNKDLPAMIKSGLFRQDLFFRLNVITVNIPPLHERMSDIPLLSNQFLESLSLEHEKHTLLFLEAETLDFFRKYRWPGNIRELKNVLEYAVIYSDSPAIKISHLPEYLLKNNDPPFNPEKGLTLSIMENKEKNQIKKLLVFTNYNLSAVSRELNIARSTLYRKLKKYGLNNHAKEN